MEEKKEMNLIRGRLGAMKMSISKFAKLMGISRPTARKKIDGDSEFTVAEMERACEILCIAPSEAYHYFFAR